MAVKRKRPIKKIKLISVEQQKIQSRRNALISFGVVIILFLGSIALALLFSSTTEQPGAAVRKPRAEGAPSAFSASLQPSDATALTPFTLQYGGLIDENTIIRWVVDTGIAQEGPEATLAPGAYQKGNAVHAEIVVKDPSGNERVIKTEPVIIGNSPPVLSMTTIDPPEAAVGAVLTATPVAEDPDRDFITYTYQWGVNEKPVEGQNQSAFSTAGLKKKDMVYVLVTATDGTDAGEQQMSDVVVLANSAPQITSMPKYEIINGVYTYHVTAKDPDGDRLTFRIDQPPGGMTIDPATGMIRWEVPKEVAGTVEVPIKILADDGDGGTAVQEYSVILKAE